MRSLRALAKTRNAQLRNEQLATLAARLTGMQTEARTHNEQLRVIAEHYQRKQQAQNNRDVGVLISLGLVGTFVGYKIFM